ncbi:MAG: hypothetical protein WCA20_33775 [Candidatus Sulfotelmatobacter sp.]
MAREPEQSDYFNKPIRGKPMARADALAIPVRDECFVVADFVAFNDPAVTSYLIGLEVSVSGRKGID